MDILPGISCQSMLTRDYSVLISRVLVTYFEAFSMFSKLIPWHIPHEFSVEMQKKSEVVSISKLASFVENDIKSQNISLKLNSFC